MAPASDMSSPPPAPSTPDDLFEEVLAQALDSDDVQSSVRAGKTSVDELAAEVRSQRDGIFQRLSPEIGAYNDTLTRLKAVYDELGRTPPPSEGEAEHEPPHDKALRVKAVAATKRSVDEIIASPAQAELERDLYARLSEVDAAGANLRNLMFSAVSQACRSALNELNRERRFATRLRLDSTEGLAQVVDHELEIPTRAVEELRDLLRRMKGGSVGVSGPRGAGKTTLLARFCEGRESFGDRELRSVLVPAPVAYDSREFLGHLTAELCLTLGGRPPDAQRAGDDDAAPDWNWQAAIGRLLLVALFALAPLAALAGLAGLVSEVQSTFDPQGVWGVAAVAGGVALMALAPPVTKWLSRESLPPAALFMVARMLLWLGLAFVFGGIALVAAAVLGATASEAAIRAAALLLVALAVIACALELLLVGLPGDTSDRVEPPPEETDSLVNVASALLADINYQQSQARGWSGGVALGPVTGTVSGETTLARQVMTYPELVSRLRGLLALAAKRFDVLIGVDELDKLESGEKADRFLNELKAMFGVPSVYFLVSVSEDAMSRFERRGLPFRDVFDSTFDEIVRVEPLTLGEAQQLLNKRLVGVPLIFSALCHVVSGGLPRDLIRTARGLVELYEGCDGKNDLENLTQALILDELTVKADAVRFAARTEAPPEPLLTNFVNWLGAFGETVPDRDRMIAFCREIDRLATTRLAPGNTLDAAGRAKRSTVLRMGLELGAYSYFAATVLEVFRNDLTPDDIVRTADGASEAPALEGLAQARAAFVVNPYSAWHGVSGYRRGVPCDPPDVPLPPQAIA